MKANGLQKSNRLNQEKNYHRIFRSPRRFTYESLLVIVVENHLEYARLGFVVPKKNVARAVDRNKIKRVIREAFRRHKNFLKGLDVVVVVRTKQRCDPKKIAISIRALWDRISQCKKS